MAKRCRFSFFFLLTIIFPVLLQSSLRDAQSSERQLQDGSQCDSNSVTDLLGFQTKLCVTYVILQFTNSRKRGHLALSWSNLHGDVIGWLLGEKQTNKKKKKPTQNHRDDTAMSSMAAVYKGEGLGRADLHHAQ